MSVESIVAEDKAEVLQHFETRIRPLLQQQCVKCHGPEKQRAGLRLDRAADFARGADTGPIVDDDDPERSPLLKAVRYDGEIQMPPDGKLNLRQIADIEQWVRAGARWPDDSAPVRAKRPSEHDSKFTAEERSLWAFQPPRRQTPPQVQDSNWVSSPIDRFILARLEQHGLRPAPPAAKRALIRRATLDLIGLPPTPDEVASFLDDTSPMAFARVVDRLLASPHYGERWGRHWLDVVRYADSNGLDENMAYEHAWHYRDYVIRAFNADKPFDRFVCEQLAGDLLPQQDGQPAADAIIATGFLALGPKSLREVDAKKMEVDIIDEQVSVVGEALLGLTLGCARCHDHKFDPIRMEDYYALAGIFSSTRTMKTHGSKTGVGNGEWLERELPGDTPRTVMAVEDGQAHDLPVHLRGSHLAFAETAVPRGFPEILGGDRETIGAEQSGRLQLARWLTQPDHPLTSRVIVNRVWQRHFGEGVVRTPNNFGWLGERPDHPELLDWLATELVRDGWSLKSLHRRIMLSNTYQMSTVENARAKQIDPDNRLLWHMNRRRMDAETIRDSILAVSGDLERSFGGSLLGLTNRQYVTDAQSSQHLVTYESHRRSVYLPVIRNIVYSLFRAFDFPDPSVSSESRAATVVAPQALLMMNGDFVLANSRKLASRLRQQTELSDSERLQALYEAAFSRPALPDEVALALEYLDNFEATAKATSAQDDARPPREMAWQSLCQALLASNEFLYIE